MQGLSSAGRRLTQHAHAQAWVPGHCAQAARGGLTQHARALTCVSAARDKPQQAGPAPVTCIPGTLSYWGSGDRTGGEGLRDWFHPVLTLEPGTPDTWSRVQCASPQPVSCKPSSESRLAGSGLRGQGHLGPVAPHPAGRGLHLPRPLTCEDDVGYAAVAGEAELLCVRQAPVAAREAHHGRLGVVECRARAVQAAGADGILYHVELLQLGEEAYRCEASPPSWPPWDRGRGWLAGLPATASTSSPTGRPAPVPRYTWRCQA